MNNIKVGAKKRNNSGTKSDMLERKKRLLRISRVSLWGNSEKSYLLEHGFQRARIKTNNTKEKAIEHCFHKRHPFGDHLGDGRTIVPVHF